MKFEFDNNLPIHSQLEEQISYYIVSGYLKPSEKIPSVREFAIIADVNHNTVQKALNDIENSGLIYTNRTNGKFVTDDIGIIDKVRDLILETKINVFLDDLNKIGVYRVKVEIEKEKNKELNNYEFVRMPKSK